MSPTVAEPPIPREAFEQHPGQWVAVRGTTVIAWAETLEELTGKPEIADTDTLAHVPDGPLRPHAGVQSRGRLELAQAHRDAARRQDCLAHADERRALEAALESSRLT